MAIECDDSTWFGNMDTSLVPTIINFAWYDLKTSHCVGYVSHPFLPLSPLLRSPQMSGGGHLRKEWVTDVGDRAVLY